MNRLQFDGAWEGDCYPGGRFCASYPDGRLQTHTGIWTPGDWLRYPVLSPVADVVAGTTQNDPPRILEGSFGVWQTRSSACGTNAAAYWPDGRLEVNPDCREPYFGLGIRYITDRAIPCAETYIDNQRQIYEFTDLHEITAGQGGEGPHGADPCVILYNGRRYLLEAGQNRVVRFRRQGDQLAIGFFAMDRAAFVAYWLNVSEISSLPDITDPEDPDEPEEPEEPEEPVDFPPIEWETVVDMHERFAVDFPATEEGARGWTEMAIEQLAFSFPNGGWCWKKAAQNSPPSKDCIARQTGGRFEGWDVLIGAGVNGPRVLAGYPPTYHDLVAEGNQVPIQVEPVDWLGLDEPEEPEEPSELEQRVDLLEAQVELQKARIANLEDRVSTLEQHPPQNGVTPAQVLGLIDAAFANAEITGRTQSAGGILSHSHGVSGLAIRRRT